MRTTTTRGVLWEVLAPIVRWPMYSPARFGLVVLVLLGAVLVSGELSSGGAGGTADRATATELATTDTAPSASGSSTTEPAPSETAAAGTKREVRRLARRFGRVYVDPWIPRRTWLRKLAAMSTSELTTDLETVDQANIEIGDRVRHIQISGVGTTAASVVVRTNHGQITLDLAFSGSQWEVTTVTPSEPTTDPTA